MDSNSRNSAYRILLTEDADRIFLVPQDIELPPGQDVMQDLEQQQLHVDITALAQYECDRETASKQLNNTWTAALEAAKSSWQRLFSFTQMTSGEAAVESIKTQLQQGIGSIGPEAQEIFNFSQEMVQSISKAAESNANLEEGEQKEQFIKLFSQVPQVMEQFTQENLEEAFKDPDRWADSLYQQMFHDMDRGKLGQRQERLKSEIQESIARGLRKAGMEPSIDRGKNIGTDSS